MMMPSDFSSRATPFISSLTQTLKASPKRVVFTEGEDERILSVAAALAHDEIILPVLLGNTEKMGNMAADLKLKMDFVRFIDPKTSPQRDRFAGYFERSEKIRGERVANAGEMMERPHYFGAMMLQYGQVDGMLAGNQSLPANVYRSAIRMLKPLPEVERAFSMVILADREDAPARNFGKGGILILADCNLLVDPSVKDLATVAVETGRLAQELLGRRPRIGMLSHSNYGSASSDSSRKMLAATRLAQDLANQRNLDIEIRGELHADVAMCQTASMMKTNSQEFEPCDVLVFPNQDAGHISYKLLRHVGGFPAFGQVLVGLGGPVAQVPRNASAERIYGTAAVIGAEAIKYHSMFPLGLY